jgi:tRNA(Ile)-lysidine synthase
MRKRPAPEGSPGSSPLPGLRLPERGQKIVVGVSGGLDSMVLLHTLNALAGFHRWKLSVAHFNHCLRGRDSDEDQAFVERTATMMKLPFFQGKADVRSFSEQENLSIEMAARRLRHEFFAHTARLHGVSTVALAHHADDQVELFFLRLLAVACGQKNFSYPAAIGRAQGSVGRIRARTSNPVPRRCDKSFGGLLAKQNSP